MVSTIIVLSFLCFCLAVLLAVCINNWNSDVNHKEAIFDELKIYQEKYRMFAKILDLDCPSTQLMCEAISKHKNFYDNTDKNIKCKFCDIEYDYTEQGDKNFCSKECDEGCEL